MFVEACLERGAMPEDRIKFNDYSPRVKSLGTITGDGRRATGGIVLEEQPEHFHAEEKETITVNNGSARINGKLVHEGQTVVIEAGNDVRFEALGAPVLYTCVYGDVAPMSEDDILAVLGASKGCVVKFTMKNGVIQNYAIHFVTKSAYGDSKPTIWVGDTVQSASTALWVEAVARVLVLTKEEKQ